MRDLFETIERALGESYRLERELTGGGMSSLFLATDRALNRPVVIKVLPPELASEVSASRFQQEVEFLAQLQHPHILSILGTGCYEQLLYYITPYVAGESLRDRMRQVQRLTLHDAWFILCEIAGALAYAHARGIIHRDIKPENILLQEGHAILADFGASRALNESIGKGRRHTETGFTIGTPGYMAPEQLVGGREVDHRADIYALAVVGYEMLAGTTPARARGDGGAVLFANALDPPALTKIRPHVPARVSDAIARGLARDPDERFQSAADFQLALEAAFKPRARVSARRLALAGAAALAVATVAGVAVWPGGWSGENRQGSFLGTLVPESQADSVQSIAVLPFANSSQDPANDYISDGITEELIGALSQIELLRVAARTSVFALRGKAEDVRDIGRQLDVSSILEGSVQRSANRLKITARLVSAKDGFQLWSGSFERELDDIFLIQNEIASAIVGKLRVRLAPRAGSPLVERSTESAEAYNLYLQGRFHWNKRTVSGVRRAAALFEEALAIDSNFALAYSGLADSYALLGSFEYAALSAAEAFPKVKRAALQALKLDNDLAEAHASLANALQYYDWDWSGAEAEYRRALQLKPDYATALHWYGTYLVARGRTDQGVATIERAYALEPMSVTIGAARGRLLYLARRYDEAVAQFQRTLDLDSSYVVGRVGLALVYQRQGMHGAAITELEKARALSSGTHAIIYPLLGYSYGRSGKLDRARQVLAALEKQSRQRYVPPEFLAIVQLGLGDTRATMNSLEKAYESRSSALVYLKVEPLLDPLRGEARFQALVKRLGL